MFDLFNKPVLDDAVAGGKEIRFSHYPEDYLERFLFQELEYLQTKYGFTTLDPEGDVWIARK